ncbi:type VII secretion target [Rhodococcus sp. NPDC059968]|uniref:type VII secretion target n=1 Tax=Rhodococcus sp. NPDC059968 TaxID=3347017 RepID=UPI0036702802
MCGSSGAHRRIVRGEQLSGKLQVDPAALDGLARNLRELSAQTEPARSYLNRWLGLSTASGRAFFEVTKSIAEVRDRLDANYAALGSLSDRSATELESAASMYRTTDHAYAAELDRKGGILSSDW